ncbi:sulfurtransferase TusA family protein [uncultured Alcanivorax sp.]|uniref:sulfurtransferase TusA family protein n=1 Tax=uncultured Alcanivorax sp. TaxID=191215 RepID=UPI002632262A|nr:sulfurtransferase TusA family protein [uncultured Alcanivorax sp.]
MMTEALHELDVRRMLCPMPVIKTQNKVRTLATGDCLRVVCTDPGALNDIPAWCRINGHEVLETGEAGSEVFVVLRVGEDNGALF